MRVNGRPPNVSHASMHTPRTKTVEGGRFLGPLARKAVRCTSLWDVLSTMSKFVSFPANITERIPKQYSYFVNSAKRLFQNSANVLLPNNLGSCN